MNLIFIPKFGAVGAAIGTLIAEFAVTTIQIIYLRKYISKVIIVSLIQSIICTIPIFFIIKLFTHLIINQIILIIVSIIASVLLYAIELTILKNTFFLEYSSLLLNKIFKRKQ